MKETRDGLRASCPRFMTRFQIGDKCTILCGSGKQKGHDQIQFGDRELRDTYYRTWCCGDYRQCVYWREAMMTEKRQEEEQDMSMAVQTKQAAAPATIQDYEARIRAYREQTVAGMIGIGRTLNEAKDARVVPHGQWEDWATRTTGLSLTMVQRMMRIAREVDEGSAMNRLEPSKVLMLISAPIEPETREALAKRTEAESLTVRQLRDQITRLTVSAQTDAHTIKDLERAVETSRRELDEETKKRDSVITRQHDMLSQERRRVQELQTDLQRAQEFQRQQGGISEEAQAVIDELKADLEAAERREQRRSAQLEELKQQRDVRELEQGRDISARALSGLDVAQAVRRFLGEAGVLPQMGTSLRQLSEGERQTILENVEAVSAWVEGAREALGFVRVDGGVA